MRSIMLSTLLAGLALVGGASLASAQVGFGIYVGPGYYDDGPYYGYSEPAPRVYSYRRYYNAPVDNDVDALPRRSGGCGTYYYWDGETCVDARRKRNW